MKKDKIEINKWHFKFGIIPTYWKQSGYMFHFGIFKVIRYPVAGERIDKNCYKGFWIRKEFDWRWKGFEISL